MAALTVGGPSARAFFENGGTIVVSDATNDYTLTQVVEGSLRVTPGHNTTTHDQDRNTILAPRYEKPVPSQIEFAIRQQQSGDTTTVDDFLAVLDPAPTTANAPEFTIVITIFDGLGLATGVSYTYANCALVDGYSRESTENAEAVRLMFRSRTLRPTVATVS